MTRSELIYNRFNECVHNGEVENNELKKLIIDLSEYLGLKTLTSYAKNENISYQAATKRNVEKIKIDTIEFIIDNE